MTVAPDVSLAMAEVPEEDVVEANVVSGRVRAVGGGANGARTDRGPGGGIAVGPRMTDDPRRVLAGLYAAHAGAIQRFLRDLLGDPTLAADGTQETFARAFRGLATLREQDKPLPWLFGIARHVSLEYRKARRAAKGRFAEGDEMERAPCGARSPEALLIGREAADVVRRALGELSEERRAALLLRVDHGLSYDEIAGALGWSLAKAKVEVFRGREALREVMRAYEGGAS